jgi:hypothetical protein
VHPGGNSTFSSLHPGLMRAGFFSAEVSTVSFETKVLSLENGEAFYKSSFKGNFSLWCSVKV